MKYMPAAIEQNIRAHNRIANQYERRHPEIYNSIEQGRLHIALRESILHINTGSALITVLDFGCGSGNLTDHLLQLGTKVIAADLSPKFLALIDKRFGSMNMVTTLIINGSDLENIADDSVDMVATYSVLHHVPNYLAIIKEFVRVVKPGGIIYIDHEVNSNHWNPTPELKEYLLLTRSKNKNELLKFFYLKNYIGKIRRLFNKRFADEGDIHVWLDDHIEWDKIINTIESEGASIIDYKKYLLYVPGCPIEKYEEYKKICSNASVLIARK